MVSFPTRERPGEPARVLHPALVLSVQSPAGVASVTVLIGAFGSSQAHGQIKPWQVHAGRLAGQVKPTIFDLSRRALLPFTKAYFPFTTPFARFSAALEPEIEAALIAAIEEEQRGRR